MTFRLRGLLAALALLAVSAAPAFSGTWNVGRDQLDCTPPCNWYDGHPQVPFPGFAIQTAMMRPEVLPGDTVLVWPRLGGLVADFPAKIPLKSGVVLISAGGPAVTLLAGSGNAEAAVTMAGADCLTTVEGFTFTWDALLQGLGGGVSAFASCGRIRNNIFVSNKAGIGSAIYLQSCNLLVENNLFVTNNCMSGGGTVAVSGGTPTIRNNTFSANFAPFGFEGATLYATGTDVIFERNIVHGSQGASAVFCGGGNHPTIACNLFWDNPFGAFAGQCVDSVGTSGNLSGNPLFCNVLAQNYGVCADSPALTGPCGTIGYTSPGGNCPACMPTAVAEFQELSWGRIKSDYRHP